MIKKISRGWCMSYLEFSETYTVGEAGVISIKEQSVSTGGIRWFNIEKEECGKIEVTDAVYVEYFPSFETKEATGERPEFPKDRENV